MKVLALIYYNGIYADFNHNNESEHQEMMTLKTVVSDLSRVVAPVLFGLSLCSGSAWAGGDGGVTDDGVMVTYVTENDFASIKDNVVLAIQGKGLNIANELHASEMLNRTGPDLGYANNTYKHAETVEFCSATISLKLAAINPANISLCPFAVSIYVLTTSPTMVNVTYRHPVGNEASQEAIGEVEALVKAIVEEAME